MRFTQKVKKMKEHEIENYFKLKENSISIDDKKELSSIRYNVLNNSNKKKSTVSFRPVYASLLAIAPILFFTLQSNESNVDIVSSNDYGYALDLVLQAESLESESLYEMTDTEFTQIMVSSNYKEEVLDFYY